MMKFVKFGQNSGMGPVTWVINAEIFPNWARGTGVATATGTNWLFNFIIAQTFLQLVTTIPKYGSIFFKFLKNTLIFFLNKFNFN